jgi:phenol 2-monooxygenase
VTAPTARYPYECTLHQGEIENIFLDSMRKEGLEVDRPVVPISLQLSQDQKELTDPHAYPVKVCTFPTFCPYHPRRELTFVRLQLVLKHLDRESGDDAEIVRAKFVVGSDGAHSWVRKTLGISMDGEQTGTRYTTEV